MIGDLSKIPPLTEAEADFFFGQPSARENYDTAMAELAQREEYHHEAIHRYVNLLLVRLREAKQDTHRAEARLQNIRDNY